MKVAVVGGTGVAGRATVAALQADGHEALVLSRSTGVDLATGAGLVAALTGADAVVDATNVATMKAREAEDFFERTARNLIDAAAAAGLGHVVALSIIGIDRVPFGYYQGKVRQESVLKKSSVPVTILRAAQFHEFAGQYLDRNGGRLVVVPRWRVQPVSAREVGETLASLAVRPAAGHQELAGPEEEIMADLVRRVAAARQDRRRVLSVRLPGAAGKAMAKGGNLPSKPGLRGTQTFADWLTNGAR
jgi:uncharacterized protein YbjT (DUF2867 family)